LQTLFDWISILIFAGLVVLYLQRSMADGPPVDRIAHYAPPAIGCAAGNFVGNQGATDGRTDLQLLAAAILVAAVVYILQVLKPFSGLRPI
jgi:hypothetical protein